MHQSLCRYLAMKPPSCNGSAFSLYQCKAGRGNDTDDMLVDSAFGARGFSCDEKWLRLFEQDSPTFKWTADYCYRC